MASDGDRPRLPDTDDPFILLGIGSDADDKQVRQAYARLIRVHRPDRSPSEFQRVHAAFEAIKHMRQSGAAPDSIRFEPKTPVTSPERAPPLNTHVDDVGVAHAARERWRAAWQHAFEHDLNAALALLDDEKLRLDAADDPDIAAMCLRRIGALAWRKSYDAEALLAKYARALPRHDFIDWLLDSVGLELAAINSLANQRELGGVFDRVRTLLVAMRICGQQECVQEAQQLYDRLAGDPDRVIGELDGLEGTHDLGALFELIYSYVPSSFTSLEDIPKPRFDLLSGTLFDAGAQPQRWKVLGGAGGAAVVAGLTIGVLPVLGLAGVAVGFGLATERWRYKNEIRPRLLRAIVALPVTSGVIARWVRFNSKLAGRLSRFEPGIGSDPALYTFSMLAVLAAAVGSED